jgi:hypothetical protein
MLIEKNKTTSDPVSKLKKELEAIINSNFLDKLIRPRQLKKEVAELGLALIHKEQDEYYHQSISLGSKQAILFTSLIKNQIWEDEDYYALLVYFFGEEQAVYVKYAWNLMRFKMYQTGEYRRSFRAPDNNRYVLLNQVNFLRSVLISPSRYDAPAGFVYYDKLSLEEQIIYDNNISQGNYQFLIWSAAIDLGNAAIYQLAEDIIFNKHPEGKVTRNLIKALLNSDQIKCWELVEKLLLSAQRQEGLRQTILEALDETSIGALQYMIHVIVDNKLTRFSSVVRAIGTWTGLGWEAEKETTVRSMISLADQYFVQPALIEKAIHSKNNNEIYMALWAQGVLNVEKTGPFLHELLDNGSVEKGSLALLFAGQVADPNIEFPLYVKAIQNGNLQLLACALPGLEALLRANAASGYYINHPEYIDLFKQIYGLSQSITLKDKLFEGKVFSWNTVKFERDRLYSCLFYLIGSSDERLQLILQHFDNLSIGLREKLTQSILKSYYADYYYKKEEIKDTPTEFQRTFALKLLQDRGDRLVASAINLLQAVELQESDLEVFAELLKRKNTSLRKRLLELLLNQKDFLLTPFLELMLKTGNVEQRLAGLELILNLQRGKRLTEEITRWTNSYGKSPKISEKEIHLFEQLLPANQDISLTEANGYGFFNPEKITPYTLPIPKNDGLFLTLIRKEKYGFSMPLSAIIKQLDVLVKIFKEHADYEYEVEYANHIREKVLLGNIIKPIKPNEPDGELQNFENWPLYQIWDNWFISSGLTGVDLFLLTLTYRTDYRNWKDFLIEHIFYFDEFLPDLNSGYYYWNNPYVIILKALQDKYSFPDKNEFVLDATCYLYNKLTNDIINYKYVRPATFQYYQNGGNDGDGWQKTKLFDVFLDQIKLEELTIQQVDKAWNIFRWRQFNGLPEKVKESMPPIYLYCQAFETGIIGENEMYEGILQPDRINVLTSGRKHYQHYESKKLIEKFPFLQPMVDKIRNSLLDVELKRGDIGTTVTLLVQNIQKLYGSDRLISILTGLGKLNLYRTYIYSYSDAELTKQMLFSQLLKLCHPAQDDSQEKFNKQVIASKLTEIKLIQAAVYAPQWQKYISSYLGWKGLDSAIWWMHAHTKSSGYQYQNLEAESEIAKYSSVELQDFTDGAVDKAWFESAYKQLGKARWEIIYESAKYITDGNGHRRAKLYADTLLDNLKIREVTAKVKDKRDQDFLRVYGLVPLSKTNAEKDLLTRYEYLQQFKKESREFGSMRQSSEALAIRVAMENLARNAGFTDPQRLSWAMETKQVQSILSKDMQLVINGTTVNLIIDANGKAELITWKGDKKLSAIPANIKKDPAVVALAGHKKTLKEQWSRSRKSLEEAMIRGDEFLFSEISNLIDHPVISKHLEKLVFVTDQKEIGFIKDKFLVNILNVQIHLEAGQTIRIAHCVDLHQSGKWVAFQGYCFEKQLKQPFKQIFRELYLPTADELNEKSISRRYAGHQIQPSQTLSLLKTRGWKADYEEGLQKVFHKEGFHVKLYAMANWYSPADAESPVLETIEFHSLKDGKNIPFTEIDARIFSEVMRDIDLVVSVAHVGGTDPEASQSSIEMRSMLLREVLHLFKIYNTEIKGSHAIIKGTLGDYSIHLGSAIVHQLPGKYLSVLPVHSQHRGRLFLPFADDDPKSAELMSKVLMFAKDDQIQDPTILSQIEPHLH